jgi:excisionase family DNA binding protein
MSDDRVPLYVRLPREQAASIDRLVSATGRRKQQLVSDLLSDRLVVGRAEIAGDAGEILTLEEAGALLRVSDEALRARAEAGEIPGRRFGDEWRFVRSALLKWLQRGEPARGEKEPSG